MTTTDLGDAQLAAAIRRANRIVGTKIEGKHWTLTPRGRRTACANDPLLFAYIYLRHHLRSEETGDVVTFSEAHVEWTERAKDWRGNQRPGPQEWRHVEVAPRGTGKSTWWFLILPMWAAAFEHAKFIAAFADSATQAETHLQTFKHELDTNELLRQDFPLLVQPGTRPRRGTQIADNRAMLFAASGFVFTARGIDSAVLGLKVGRRRPDLIIFDDVEPEEARYSGDQMKKRLGTIRDGVLPLNVNARVVIVGTVTMPGSIIHQLVRSARIGDDAEEKPEEWIAEENFTVHHYPAILVNDDGTRRSLWPGRWSLDFLESIEHTRSYLKNYANDPRGYDGGYWSDDDFEYGELQAVTRRMLSVDPAVTTKKTSDPTGLAILGYSPSEGKVQVEHGESVRLAGADLREHCLRLVEKWEDAGTPIGLLYVETNQGGELWADVFHDFPIKVRTVHQTEKKEVRAASALSWYQRGRVKHVRRLTTTEEQMIGFPNAPHDDEVDAVGSGVLRFLDPPKRKVGGAVSVSTI